jgi:hypothetical protein
MPGRRPIDISQFSSDKANLKSSLSPKNNNNIALKTLGLSQFYATTSLQLLNIITDPSGTGNLVFNTNPLLTSPQIGTNNSVILTSDVVTGSTTANQILMRFPMYDIENPTPVYGTADILIQVDVGTLTTLASYTQNIVQKRVTKILALFDNDTNNLDDPSPAIAGQDRQVYLIEYATVNSSGYNSISSIGTFDIIKNTGNLTFDLVVTPASNKYMKYRVIATCVISSDFDFKFPVTETPAELV